jgi:hypothetical protein
VGRATKTLVAGVTIAFAYAALALLSGQLNPTAGKPILDGLVPPQQYLWVDPPAALEPTNVQPVSETATLRLTPRGSPAYVLTTADAQATLVLPEGAIAARDDQVDARLSIEPLDPAGFAAPDPPLRILGNVYRFQATYLPGELPVDRSAVAIDVVLVYPLAPNDHGTHQLVFSSDGQAWTPLETDDAPAIPTANAAIDRPGYIAVAGEVQPDFTAAGDRGWLAIVAAIVTVGLASLGAATLILRRRRPR